MSSGNQESRGDEPMQEEEEEDDDFQLASDTVMDAEENDLEHVEYVLAEDQEGEVDESDTTEEYQTSSEGKQQADESDSDADSDEGSVKEQPPADGPLCKHYVRRCKLICPKCDEPAACRLCHEKEEGHALDRQAVREVICVICKLRQPVSKT